MTMIYLTKNELQAVASMINLTSVKDHVQSLTMVKLDVATTGEITLIATNRMVIAEQSFMPYNPVTLDEPISILLSPNILKAFKASKFDGTLLIEEGLAITFSTTGSGSISEPLFKGAYPDITDHLPSKIQTDTLTPATDFVRLNLDFVTKISKLVSPVDTKADLPVFAIFTQDSGGSSKPKPVIFERVNIRAIIQPVMSK